MTALLTTNELLAHTAPGHVLRDARVALPVLATRWFIEPDGARRLDWLIEDPAPDYPPD